MKTEGAGRSSHGPVSPDNVAQSPRRLECRFWHRRNFANRGACVNFFLRDNALLLLTPLRQALTVPGMAIELTHYSEHGTGMYAFCDVCRRRLMATNAIIAWIPNFKQYEIPLAYKVVCKGACLHQLDKQAGEQHFTLDLDAAVQFLAWNTRINWKEARRHAEAGMSL